MCHEGIGSFLFLVVVLIVNLFKIYKKQSLLGDDLSHLVKCKYS